MAPLTRWQGTLLTVVLLALDQATKALAPQWARSPLVEPATNDALMFGLDAGLSRVSVLVLCGAVMAGWWWFGRSAGGRTPAGCYVLAAGVAGNVIDRLVSGAVRDWLVIGPTTWNLADVVIVAGLVLLATTALDRPPNSTRKEPQWTGSSSSRTAQPPQLPQC